VSRALAVVTVCVLFIAGIAIGALGMHLYYDQQLERRGGPPGMRHRLFARHLHSQLDLTPEQQSTIDDILERSHTRANELRHDIGPRIHAIMERAHEEIEAVLTPEQREKFRGLLSRQPGRGERFLLGPPGGHGPGRRIGWGRGPEPPDGPPGRPGEGPPDDSRQPPPPPPPQE
jgi:Spy/CpxP family protein refolding chaperone